MSETLLKELWGEMTYNVRRPQRIILLSLLLIAVLGYFVYPNIVYYFGWRSFQNPLHRFLFSAIPFLLALCVFSILQEAKSRLLCIFICILLIIVESYLFHLAARRPRVLALRSIAIANQLDSDGLTIQSAAEFERALELSRKAVLPLEEFICLRALSELHLRMGHFVQAKDLMNALRAESIQHNNTNFLVSALCALGELEGICGNTELAFRYYSDAIAFSQSSGNLFRLADALSRRASLERALGRVRDASTDLAEAAGYYKELAEFSLYINTQVTLGSIQLHLGDYDQARQTVKTALEKSRAVHVPLMEGKALMFLGQVEQQARNLPLARDHYRAAQAIFQEHNATGQRGNVLVLLGDLELQENHLSSGSNYFGEARSIFITVGDRLGEGNALTGLADFEAKSGHLALAKQYYFEAVSLCREDGNPRAEARVLLHLIDLDVSLGDTNSAELHSRQALEAIASTQIPLDLPSAGRTPFPSPSVIQP